MTQDKPEEEKPFLTKKGEPKGIKKNSKGKARPGGRKPDNVDKSRPDTTLEAMAADGSVIGAHQPYILPSLARRTMKWSQEVEDEIIDRILHGESLIQICHDEHLPSHSTFLRWVEGEMQFLVNDPKTLKNRYAQAMQIRIERLIEEAFEIADDASRDTTTINTPYGEKEVMDREWVQRSAMRVDLRKWYISKIAPQKYGDKIQVDSNVQVSGNVMVEHGIDLKTLTTAARKLLRAFLQQVEADKESGAMVIEGEAKQIEG